MALLTRVRRWYQPLSPEDFVRRPAQRELREAERGLLEERFKMAKAQARIAYFTAQIENMRKFTQELGR